MGSRAYDLFWGTTLRTLTRGHRVLHRVSGGRLGRRFPGGQQVVWIMTLGRRSGQWRRNPLLSVRDGSGPDACWVITGSNAGQAKVPGWVFNARHHPDGFLEVDGQHFRVRFEEAEGEDRDALYARLTATWRSFATYEDHAGRQIPVFRIRILAPVDAVLLPETG